MMQMASMGQSRAAGCRSAPCDAAGRAVWDLGLAWPRVAGRTAMPEMAMARIRSRCWVGAERELVTPMTNRMTSSMFRSELAPPDS